jgi:two-component system, NtrC family, sensor kinase
MRTSATTDLSLVRRDRRARLSLGARLFIWIFSAVVLALAIYSAVVIRTASENGRRIALSGADRSSELIRRATRHAMLLNRKEDVHEIVEEMAALPGVAGVHIYDKRGVVVASGLRREIGNQVDMEAEACVACHDRERSLSVASSTERVRVYRGADGQRVLGLISPIENEPECAACHVHRTGQTVLGVLDVKMSLADTDARLAAMRRDLVFTTFLAAALIGAASAGFIHRVVRLPVNRLAAGARRIAHGDLGARVAVGSRDEVGDLAAAFNSMAARLEQAQTEIREWSETLEKKVEEKTESLTRAEAQMRQMEKMASLGKLAATVAHELNNPLAGILTYAKLVEREIADGVPQDEARREVVRYLGAIQRESARCGGIVRDLLSFARRSEARLVECGLNTILDRSLLLVEHQIRIARISLETRPLDGDDRLTCDPEKLQQALVALLVNAVEAMSEGGALTVAAARDEREPYPALRIDVIDTGIGIAPDALPHIFEPFFSTKEGASGVGLGLSVVYGIVQQLGGRIEVESSPGRGTAFHLIIPRNPSAPHDKAPGGADTREHNQERIL